LESEQRRASAYNSKSDLLNQESHNAGSFEAGKRREAMALVARLRLGTIA